LGPREGKGDHLVAELVVGIVMRDKPSVKSRGGVIGFRRQTPAGIHEKIPDPIAYLDPEFQLGMVGDATGE